jgi:hypothetical protein
MPDEIKINMTTNEIVALSEKVEADAISALRKMIRVVRDQVLNWTPRYTGKSQSMILTREEEGGRVQYVYTDHVVNKVMEGNPHAVWKRWPPFAPLKEWAMRKVGLGPKEAARMAVAIRRKLKLFGMQLPLKNDGRGMMFKRTFDLMRQTNFHWVVFRSAVRQSLRGRTT